MRLLIVTNGDGFADMLAHELIERHREFEVAGVIFTSISLRQKIRLIKTAVKTKSLYFACYLYFESAVSRLISSQLRMRKILDYCKKKKIPYITCQDLNSDLSIEFLKSVKPDIVLSLRPGQLFRANFITEAKQILNVHCSKLPEYRGMGAALQTLAAGEKKTFVTLHLIDTEELDDGPVVLQKKVTITKKQTLFGLNVALYCIGSKELVKGLKKLKKGSFQVKSDVGTLYSWPGKEPLIAIKKQGRKLLSFRDFSYRD
ncbi:MAG: formyltransferase family protein [Flavobacteriaceae bacterium]